MPNKKVALVDIDGCLIQKNKLNKHLVELLRNEHYDEIILFTQRSKLVQRTNIAAKLSASNSPGTDILTTKQAVELLSKALNKTIRVSTSVDSVFGKPLEYFETQLKDFEERFLPAEIQRQDGDSGEVNASIVDEINNESEAVVTFFKKAPSNDYTEEGYPRKKVEQFMSLDKELSTDGVTVTYDYFDDNYNNLIEIQEESSITNKPKCYVVTSKNILPLSAYTHELDTLKKINKTYTQLETKERIILEKSDQVLSDSKGFSLQPNHTLETKIALKHYEIITRLLQTVNSDRFGNPEEHLKKVNENLGVIKYYAHASLGGVQRQHDSCYRATYGQTTNIQLRERLQDLKGDVLKTNILINFKIEIDECKNIKQLNECVDKYQDEYKILAKGQGAFTRGIHSLGFSFFKTDSANAFNKIVDEARQKLSPNTKLKVS